MVRIATFNIRHGAHEAGRVDHAGLVRACADLDADLIGLQEVDHRRRRTRFRDQATLVARRLGYSVVYGPALRTGRVGRWGNALLARGRIRDVEHIELARPSPRQPRGAILARVALPTIDVAVAVTHLQHHPDRLQGSPPEAPVQLRGLLDALAGRTPPRILLGDLNLGASSAIPILTAGGFEIAQTGATFPASRPRLTLDYIAVDGLRILDAQAVATPISDHCAVVATVESVDQPTGAASAS